MTNTTTQSTLQPQPIPAVQTLQVHLDGLIIALVGAFTSSLLSVGVTWFFMNKSHKLTIDRDSVKKVEETKEQKDKLEMENAVLLAVKNISTEIQGVRTDLTTEIQGVRTDLMTEVQGVEKRIGDKITDLRDNLKTEVQGVREQVYSIEKNLTHEISKTNSAVAVLTNMIDERVPKVPYNQR